MKKLQLAVALVVGLLAFSAYASAAPVALAAPQVESSGGNLSNAIQDKPFYHWFTKDLAKQVKADSKYNRIPLKTKAQADQFVGWLHALYRDKSTPEQFRKRVLKAYPGHEYEVDFIISCLPDQQASRD
ncbi:MAG TPA: hypothetical protein VK062_00220 [Burkholderiaceae bacterium]|nr:hypothetical protein [Burkholderiaceae bacterium]